MLRRLILLGLTGVAALPLLFVRAPLDDSAGKLAPGNSPRPSSADPLPSFEVEALGRQFRWRFRLVERPPPAIGAGRVGAGPVGNILHIPAGSTVTLRVSSADYIYTFSIPELGVDTVVVPGLPRKLQCVAERPATYRLLADPICGFRFYHDELMGKIVVERRDGAAPRVEASS